MESDLLKALHQNEAAKGGRMGSERTHVDKYLCTVCGHRHSNGWYCKHSIDAKDAEIDRLKAENQRYERLFTSREQDHKELCERYDQLEAENAILKAQLSTAQMSAIEHQAKYVTMHERHQGLWRENLNLKAQLSASEDNRRVLGAECQAWRKAWQDVPCSKPECSICLSTKATDAAKALEAP